MYSLAFFYYVPSLFKTLGILVLLAFLSLITLSHVFFFFFYPSPTAHSASQRHKLVARYHRVYFLHIFMTDIKYLPVIVNIKLILTLLITKATDLVLYLMVAFMFNLCRWYLKWHSAEQAISRISYNIYKHIKPLLS